MTSYGANRVSISHLANPMVFSPEGDTISGMDKDWKLQRYGRKDYSEIVDFPVEIVGRDGVVRRYSFEDSIRLYQRRITFAGIRYRETELIEAESQHCQSRIDQLRRSYFHRFAAR